MFGTISKESVPAWLADLSDRLNDKSRRRFERENVKATLTTIKLFIEEQLHRYERESAKQKA